MTRFYPGEEWDSTIAHEAMGDEEKAQAIFFKALAAFRSACQDAMALTELQRASIKELLDIIEGEAPGRKHWNEQITEERRAA